ncbi:MAG: efflux RND transporter periplasmic adaptor subunit [Bacteroidaceae bacterium]|nr:efflux RND transporter periplasmic adaptor subunit [Bacteroidaceae bacterium]
MKTSPLFFILYSLFFITAACGDSATVSEATASEPTSVPEAPTSAQPSVSEATASEPASEAEPETKPGEKPSLGGMVTVSPDRYASVTPLMGGTVVRLAVKPGQFVSRGAVIATLNNPDFVELQQSFLDASAQTDFLEAEYQRQQTLSSQEAASQKKVQQCRADFLSMKSRKEAAAMRLRQLGVNPERILANGIVPSLSVTSPISGYVGEITPNIGKYIETGERICSVVDQDAAMLELTAFSRNVTDVKVGTRLSFVVKVMPGEKFEAVVSHIDPIIDNSSHSLKVYAKITSHHRKFLVGMYVRATIEE